MNTKIVSLNIEGLARSIAQKVSGRFAGARLSLTAKESAYAAIHPGHKWKPGAHVVSAWFQQSANGKTISASPAILPASTMEELFNAARYGLLYSLQSRDLPKVDFEAIKAAYRAARRELERLTFSPIAENDDDKASFSSWQVEQVETNVEAIAMREKWCEQIAARFEHTKRAIATFWNVSTSRKKSAMLAADFVRLQNGLAFIRCEKSLSELAGVSSKSYRLNHKFRKEWKALAARIAKGEELLKA